jgi:hypothetical protein
MTPTKERADQIAVELLLCKFPKHCRIAQDGSRCCWAACPGKQRPAVSAKLQELMEALGPFAAAAEIKLCGEWADDQKFGHTDIGHHLTFGHLRKARAALNGAAS